MRTCRRCKETLNDSSFRVLSELKSDGSNRIDSYCMDCRREYLRNYRGYPVKPAINEAPKKISFPSWLELRP